MASEMTDWGVSEFLGMVLDIVAVPGEYFAALCTDEPGTDTDGTVLADLEPVGLGYARVSIPTGGSDWTDPDGTTYSANVNDVVFPTPTDDWPTITHFALCDSLTGGEVYLYGEFDMPVQPTPTDPQVLIAGSIILNFGSFNPSISEA